MRNKPFLTIILLNTFAASIAQIISWRYINGPSDGSIVVLLILPPLVLATLNVLLIIFEGAPISNYVKSTYIGYSLSLFSLAILTFDLSKELPPSEIILFADVLFFGLTVTLQLMFLCGLHILNLFYKRFTTKNHPNK